MTFPEPSARPDLLIIAGEHSGDAHAAHMLAAARRARPEWTVAAIGGEALAGAGAQLLYDLTAHSVVGLVEVLKNYRFFKEIFEATVAWVRQHRPRAICYVDYPGFNLRLADRLYREGLSLKGGGEIRQLYYISPQIWAWKTGRRFKMARLLDALAVIFPFEAACYADTPLPVTFVGHPFAQAGYQLPLGHDPAGPILLLPGSRRTPVGRILPLMLAGLQAYRKRHPEVRAKVLYPSAALGQCEAQILATFPELRETVELLSQEAPQTASAVLTSSGTMSLQVALAAVPGAIIYRAHPLTYWIGRRVVKIDYLGIANLILERPAWPEFIQSAARPEVLADQLEVALGKPARKAAQADAAELLRHLASQAEMAPAEWLLREVEN